MSGCAFAELEYRDGIEGRRGADQVTIRLRYTGPIDHGLVRSSSFGSANASWSHAFTDRLSAVLTVSDFIRSSVKITYLSNDIAWRQFDREAGPRFTLSLTRSLGATPQR